MGFQIRSVFQF